MKNKIVQFLAVQKLAGKETVTTREVREHCHVTAVTAIKYLRNLRDEGKVIFANAPFQVDDTNRFSLNPTGKATWYRWMLSLDYAAIIGVNTLAK